MSLRKLSEGMNWGRLEEVGGLFVGFKILSIFNPSSDGGGVLAHPS